MKELINICIHFMFQRADQRISLVCKVLVGLFFMFLAISSIPAILHKISWLTFLDFFSYVKLVITLIKYIPQVGVTKEFFFILLDCTAQKLKFSIKDLFSKYDQIWSFLGVWTHLLKKSLMESFIF